MEQITFITFQNKILGSDDILNDLTKLAKIRENQRKSNKKYREAHPEKFRQYSKKYYDTRSLQNKICKERIPDMTEIRTGP